jgi:hypothetical protein
VIVSRTPKPPPPRPPRPPPPSKYSRLWRDIPRPCDSFGAYTAEQLERMDQEFIRRGARVSRG